MILDVRLLSREMRRLHAVLEKARETGDLETLHKAKLIARVRLLENALAESCAILGIKDRMVDKPKTPPVPTPGKETRSQKPKQSKVVQREE